MGYQKVAIQGIGLMGILHFVLKGTAVVKIAILARLLTPFDVGIYGISLLVLSLFETFSELGLGTFLIQIKEKIEKYIDSIFLIQIARGFMLFLLLILSASPIAYYFHESSLLLIILIVSLVPLIKSFENPYVIIFQKELYFKKEFAIRFISSFIDIAIVIIAALVYRSITGVILGFIFSTFAYVVLSWIVVDKKPGLKFSKKKIIKVIKFAKSISILGILTYLVTRIDSFIIGSIAGISSLGGYQFAQKISYEIMNDSSAIVGKVTFPVYSKIEKDKARLRRAFFKSFRMVILFEGILAIFILVFSREIILILGGDVWLKYEILLKLFAVYGFLISSWGSIGSLFFSIARQDKLIVLTFVRLLLLAPMLFISTYSGSTEYIVYALILSLVLIFPLTFYFVKKALY